MHTPEIPDIPVKSKDKAEQLMGQQVSQVVFHPLSFIWQTHKAFRANQGLPRGKQTGRSALSG